MMMRAWATTLLMIAAACGDTSAPTGAADAGGLPSDASVPVSDAGEPASDAGALAADAGREDATPQPCAVTADAVTCTFRVTPLVTGDVRRDVYWQVPSTPPPAGGRPAVIVYQGSFFGPSSTWGEVRSNLPFGGYQQARLQALLLERGFAVVAPSAAADLAWQSNSGLDWDRTTDKRVVDELLLALARGDFEAVDMSRLYATGVSSGGYMTSRMAVDYAGRFRALAIHSASYATCAGLLCRVPDDLPLDHPPTLFLHGRVDTIVPILTMEPYPERLMELGREADVVVDDRAGHEWLTVAPERIAAWFEQH